jgi:hypothetical protein
MSLEHNPARAQNAAVNDPSYTVDDFCAQGGCSGDKNKGQT